MLRYSASDMLGGSVRVLLEEVDIGISGLSMDDCSP